MFPQRNDSEELGLKVQRAQYALEQARGVGMVRGVRVTIDAQNQLLSVTVEDEELILAAYKAAVKDLELKIEAAIHEIRSDSRLEAISTFAEANRGSLEADRVRRQRSREDEDNNYYEERNNRGWFFEN